MQTNTVRTGLAVVLSIISTAILAPPMFANELIPMAIKQTAQPEAKKIQTAQAYNDRGVTLAEQGKFAEAIAAFNQAIAIYPTFENAHNNLGLALSSQNQFAEAEAAFKEALAINPQNEETYNNLGIALGSQGNFTEAVTVFNTAIQINPSEPTSHQNLGVAFWSQGKVTEAIASLQTAKKLYASQNQPEGVQQVEEIIQQVRSR
jgi:Flp pilus assembly protein TadD